MVGSTPLIYSTLKSTIQNALYGIENWPTLTKNLDLIFRNKTEELAKSLGLGNSSSSLVVPTTYVASLLPITALYGIQCGDRDARASELEEFLPAVKELYNISRIYGDATVCK